MEKNRSIDLSIFHRNTSPSPEIYDQNFTRDDPPTVNDQQEITIFYNGRVCTFDLTELQARAIILLASRGMSGTTGNRTLRFDATIPLKDRTRSYSSRGLSVKKSLQSFLQDRKRRVKATSPHRR